MNLLIAELTNERIRDIQQSATRDRLARQIQSRSRPGASARRRTRMRSAVRQWFDGSHLGPVDNYVTR
jgi:hypothetical protein